MYEIYLVVSYPVQSSKNIKVALKSCSFVSFKLAKICKNDYKKQTNKQKQKTPINT